MEIIGTEKVQSECKCTNNSNVMNVQTSSQVLAIHKV